jgi:hypothetical protein
MPPCDRGTFDRGDHRLSKRETRRAHWTELAVRIDRPRFAVCNRLEIGPGAECAARARQYRNVGARVGVEAPESVKQSARGRKIDSVAPVGTFDRNHRHAPLSADGNGRSSVSRLLHGPH